MTQIFIELAEKNESQMFADVADDADFDWVG
jgi:hypothetical protein